MKFNCCNWIEWLDWMINQLNVNLSWYEIMNESVNSLKSNVIGSWIIEWKSI